MEEAFLGRLSLAFVLGVKGLGGVFSIRFRTSSREIFESSVMLDQSEPFFQARLKHIWANQHINHLKTTWENFINTDFCEIRVKDESDGGQTLYVVAREFPANIILLIGDVIHNLRCSLDYTVSELLGWKDTRLTFPMGEMREELIDSFRTEPESVGGRTKKKGRNAAIETAIGGIGKFIVEEIGPYKGGPGNVLWTLNKLDGRDKHRLLVPVIVPQRISGINAVDKNNNRIVDGTATLGPGGILNMAQLGSGGVKIESYGKPTAEIFFNEAGIIEGQRVFPTLIQMSQAVEQTIDAIAKFASIVGWERPI